MNIEEMINSKAIVTYGMTTQSVVAMEECSELIKEISKFIRGKGDKEHLTEEIADVLICIDQLQMMYNIPWSKVLEMKKHKMKRLLERVDGLEYGSLKDF